jgi:hypothetical protein
LFDREALKELLARADISNRDKLLTCLALDPLTPRKVDDIREVAIACGLRAASKWNVSSYLSKAKTLVIRTTSGWELTANGKAHVAAVAGPLLPSVSVLVVSGLRKQLPSIASETTRTFVEEAVKCLEAKLYRSAIVTSWVGAIAVLYDAVVALHLSAFNAEASKRDSKWRPAKTADDFSRMKEFDFLQILPAISVIGKNVKDELEVCLKLRNGCGHPNSLVVGEHKASAHVETLIQNVFAKF